MDGTHRRCIGLDVHRDFAQVAIWRGGLVTQAGTFATTPEGVREFAAGLGPADEVALETTGNTWAIATVLASHAGRVVVSNPVKTRAIAEAKVKTDLLTELLNVSAAQPGVRHCNRPRRCPNPASRGRNLSRIGHRNGSRWIGSPAHMRTVR
jgi:hypothetical protein